MMNSVVRYVVFSAVLLAACGGDDDDDAKGTSTKASGQTGGKVKELICGKDTCKLPDELQDEELCCIDPFAGGCGIKSDTMCRPYPDVDSRCPPPELNFPAPPGLVPRVFGCCTSDNHCGVDFGMGGCQPREFGCRFVPKDQVNSIKPMTCDGEALPLPDNCGSTMPIFMLPGTAGSGT